MRAVIVGAGAVGASAARALFDGPDVDELIIVGPHRPDDARDAANAVVLSLGPPARRGLWLPASALPPRPGRSEERGSPIEVAVLACPPPHLRHARDALAQGLHVVSVSQSMQDVRDLLGLDDEARSRGCAVVVGAGFAPGLAGVLARHAASDLDVISEIHVASSGTGGPACMEEQRRALSADALEWHEGRWLDQPCGSGRQSVAFPEPIGAVECCRAESAVPFLLVPAFPGIRSVTARVGDPRRGRLGARIRRPGRASTGSGLGALRVQVEGSAGGSSRSAVAEVVGRPGVVAGVVAGVTARWLVENQVCTGAGGLAHLLIDTGPFLEEVARRGIRPVFSSA